MESSFYYILFTIIILSLFLSWVKSEKLINPISIFVLWWGGFIFLSTFRLIGMRLPSVYTYNLLMTSVTCFSLGGITFIKAPSKKTIPIPDLKKSEIVTDKKLRYFFYFQLFCTLILIFFFTKTMTSLRSMSADMFRLLMFTDESVFGPLKIFITYIIEPSLYVSALLSMSGVFCMNLPRKFFILSMLNLVLYSAVTLGRAPIFIITLCLILSFIFAVSEKMIKLRFKHVLGISIPVLFILLISMFRRNTWDIKAFIIIRNYFIWYLTGPFTALELFIDNYRLGYDWDYSYIRGLFAGIEEVFSPLTKKIFSGYIPINDTFHEITRVFRRLGGPVAIAHNSHYTMLYEFMRDAGIYGIIFFSYLLGSVNAILYNRFKNHPSIKNYSLMIILLYLSIIGITRWELRYTWSWLTIFGIIIIANKFTLKSNKVINAIN